MRQLKLKWAHRIHGTNFPKYKHIKYYVIPKCIIRQLMESIHKVCKLTKSKVVQPLSMRPLSQSL